MSLIIKSFLFSVFTFNIKGAVTALFDSYTHEIVYQKMTVLWLRVFLSLKVTWMSFLWTKVLILINWIQLAHNAYPTYWLIYYLSSGKSWETVSVHMDSNVLCPDVVKRLYRSIRFDMTGEEVEDLFRILPWTKRLLKAYSMAI